MEASKLMEWARKEIAYLMRDDESSIGKSDEEENQVYMLALQIYDEYIKVVGNFKNPSNTALFGTVFLQLIGGNLLTPIEDNDGDWRVFEGFDPAAGNENPGYSIYECVRKPSLLKRVNYDKKSGDIADVKFRDSERSVCIDIDTGSTYSGGIGEWLLDEMLPITMPYFPTGKIKIFTEEFKAYPEGEENDTCGVIYFRLPDGQMQEVKRFFKRDAKTGEPVEINFSEYAARKRKALGEKMAKMFETAEDENS